jgi:hypothetical protein
MELNGRGVGAEWEVEDNITGRREYGRGYRLSSHRRAQRYDSVSGRGCCPRARGHLVLRI